MVKEVRILENKWKLRNLAYKATRKNRTKTKTTLIPHPTMKKTWIEINVTEKVEDSEKYSIKSKRKEPEILTIDSILNSVSNLVRIPKETIVEKTRKRNIVEARQVAMYLSKVNTRETLAEIGLRIGNKDHATVLHAIKTVKNLWETDKIFREKWQEIM